MPGIYFQMTMTSVKEQLEGAYQSWSYYMREKYIAIVCHCDWGSLCYSS